MAEIQNAQLNIICELLASTLNGTEVLPHIENYSALWREARLQGVALAVFKNIDVSVAPEQIRNGIHGEINKLIAKNMKIGSAHSTLSMLLAENGIAHCVIKGCACSMYYPDFLLRSLGDVDFLVNPEDFEKADGVLRKNGYELVTDRHKIHWIYEKNGVRFEMHREPAGIPDNTAREALLTYARAAVAASVLTETPYGSMYLPQPFYHGLIILIHIVHHLLNSGIGLRHLCDWAVFIDTLGEKEFTAQFEEKLRKLGLWRIACILTGVCEKYFGLGGCSFASRIDRETAQALITDIYEGGNLGQKKISRSQSAYLILSGKKGQSRIKRLLKTAVDIVYLKWPKSKHCKLLLPFGILWYGLRRCYRMAVGKRPMLRIREALTEAEIRNRLIEKLRLFENNEN